MKIRAPNGLLVAWFHRAIAPGEVIEVPDDRPALRREMRLAAARGVVEITDRGKEPDYAEARRRLENR